MGCPKKEEQRQAAAAKVETNDETDGRAEGGEHPSSKRNRTASKPSSTKTKKKPSGAQKLEKSTT
jgi:hypothetical protein